MKGNCNKVSLVVGIIIAIVCIPLLFINLVIIADSIIHQGEAPGFFGYKPFIVTSGSMENIMPVGSMAIVKEINIDTLKKDDIIAYRVEDGSVITHRIIDIKEVNGNTYYITKGDQNNTQDQQLVTSDMIEGKYEFKILYLGSIALFVRQPIGVICILMGVALCFMIYVFVNDKKKNKES